VKNELRNDRAAKTAPNRSLLDILVNVAHQIK
jgi:hypothetical protein